MKLRQIVTGAITLFALVVIPAAGYSPVYAAKGQGGQQQGGQQQGGQQQGGQQQGAGGNGNQQCGSTPAAQQVLSGIDQAGANCGDSRINNIFQTIVRILSMLVGVTALIAIVWAGFKYITSGGDSNKVSNAKNTLLYALVGLAVVGLAQLLVHFVLFQANK